MLSRRGGYIPGHEIVSALRERQKWIQEEQGRTIPEHDLSFLIRFICLCFVGIIIALSLAGCDGDVTVYGTPRTVNERELAKDKEHEEACKAVAPAKPDC